MKEYMVCIHHFHCGISAVVSAHAQLQAQIATDKKQRVEGCVISPGPRIFRRSFPDPNRSYLKTNISIKMSIALILGVLDGML
jgi:hypothetical protein